jgi:AmmeMemoRadiSam system protein B/AmmeMemoRadiSam system protein A
VFSTSTRRAQYAGSWYESDPAKLATQLQTYLQNAQRELSPSEETIQNQAVLAIVSPHAGYMFSGSTASYSYEFARHAAPKRIFVMGPSHHLAIHGVALPQAVSFETPLGNLQVDKETVEDLKSYPLFAIEPEVHRVEHSLELQLPLIKKAFGDVKIVPLVIGQLQDESEVRLIAEVLKGYVRKGDLIVVSSDFTHYGPRYEYEPFKSEVRENIEKLDKEAFKLLSEVDVAGWLQFEQRTHATICGFYPCAVLCAMLPPDAHARLLKYSTSQDIVRDEEHNSVSYLAIEFSGANWPQNPREKLPAQQAISFSDDEKQTILEIARRSLELYVREHKVFDAHTAGLSITPALKNCYGAFVTLYKKAPPGASSNLPRGGKDLRGCIGSIWPIRPLWQTITENAISSASKDYRFDPVRADELADLQIEISILTPPRRASPYKDIVLGEDGIILSKHDRQSVFLPFVATEFGWNLEETLTELALKAGLRASDWKQGAKFDLFQSVSVEEHE